MATRDSPSRSWKGHVDGLSSHDSEVSALLERELNRSVMFSAFIQRCRNTLAPIDRLPDELLAPIFILVRDANSIKRRPNPYAILHLGRVCKRWHRAIVSDPLLWTQIHITKFHWKAATLSFKLSHPAMVEICYQDLTRENANRFIELLALHGHRISRLELRSTDSLAIQQILSRFPLLCNIKHLTIRDNSWVTDTNRLRISDMACRLNLESLTLFGALLTFDSPAYRGLRKLHILFVMARPPDFTTDQILPVLRGCPDLEDLNLKVLGVTLGVTPKEELKWTSPNVPLPRLRNMLIQSDPEDIVYLLSHLIIPESTYVSLSFTPANVLANLAQQNDTLSECLRRISRARNEISCLVTSLSVEKIDVVGTLFLIGKGGEKLIFDVFIPPCWLVSTSIFLMLAPLFSIATLRAITLWLPIVQAGTQDWLALFPLLHNVSTIVLSKTEENLDNYPDDCVTSLVMALGGPETPSNTLFCPALEALEMRNISFRCYKEMEIGIALYESLASRSAKGAPRLKRLSFSNIMGNRSMMPQPDLGRLCDEVTFHWHDSRG